MKDKILLVDDGVKSAQKNLKDSLLSLSTVAINSSPVESSEPKFLPKKSQKDAMAAMTALSMWGIHPVFKKKTEKPLQKCGLKECNVLTIKDFCCAEHFRIAKAKHTYPRR